MNARPCRPFLRCSTIVGILAAPFMLAACQASPRNTPLPTPRTLRHDAQPEASPSPRADTGVSGRLQLLGYLGSAPVDVLAVDHNRAYLGAGCEVLILDVSHTGSATQLGHLHLAGPVLDMAVWEAHVYLVTGQEAGLYVIDASEPTAPAVTMRLYEGQRLSGVAVSEDHLYVSGEALYVLQIQGIDRVVEVTSLPYPRQETVLEGQLSVVADDRAYVAFYDARSRSGGFHILDASQPSAPAWVGRFETVKRVLDLVVDGAYVYLLLGEEEGLLAVVDVSNPRAPIAVELGDEVSWQGTALAIANGYAYLGYARQTSDSGSLTIVDVHEPSTPDIVGHLTGLPLTFGQVVIWEGRAFITTGDGLTEVDVADPRSPALRAEHRVDRLSVTARDVALRGNLAYVAAGWEGLQLVDCADSANPRLVGQFDLPGHAWAIELVDDLVYVAAENAGLLILDIHEPLQPVQVGAYDVPGPYEFFHDLALSGRYAYIADGGLQETGLRVIDLTDPQVPSDVAFARIDPEIEGRLPARAEGIAVQGEYAYLAAGTGGLRVYRLLDRTAPMEVARFNTPGRSDNLCLADGRVYLMDGDLRILDVSDPSAPMHVGVYDVPEGSYTPHVALDGSHVLLSGDAVRWLAVSDPSKLVVDDQYPMTCGAVATEGESAYVLGDGLFIFGIR